MSARPDSAPLAPSVTAILGDAELCMFEVISLEGNLLKVRARYRLAVGEELPLQVEARGRVIGRVTARYLSGDGELTEVTLADGAAAP
jgi:hypothetical protein